MHGFKQIVNNSTRITNDSSTLIDHIFVSRSSCFPSTKFVTSCISDHDFVYCRRKINTAKFRHRTIKCRNFRNYNPTRLRDDVKNINWNPIYDNNTDVNSALTYFTSELKSVFDAHAPITEKRIKGKPCDWMKQE